MKSLTVLSLLSSCPVAAFVLQEPSRTWSAILLQATLSPHGEEDRRAFLSTVATTAGALVTGALTTTPQSAQAIGPVKIALEPMSYKAAACPPSKPIPGEKAMFGMRGLCVTVQAKMAEGSPKDLEKVGVYGFVTDGETGNSVLANNPDLR
mmetsp:Transcript_25451/g.48221  ORF Transcript_25451/g.48221 Transcript_25451/m.48221 type:complete len:151 (+) Transcript_25451:98-550(+)